MMNMMTTTGWGSGLVFLWGLHVLSVVLFFVGVLFLVMWAIKHLTGTQLKTWGIWLVVIGTIACLLTIGARGAPWTAFGGFGPGGMMMQRGATSLMGWDADDDDSLGGMMGNGMGMSMMLRGRTGDDFDQAFIQLMIPHHQDAINMATMALEDAKHEEMKRLARDIIAAQQREIDQMRQWYSQWGYNE